MAFQKSSTGSKHSGPNVYDPETAIGFESTGRDMPKDQKLIIVSSRNRFALGFAVTERYLDADKVVYSAPSEALKSQLQLKTRALSYLPIR
jgi:hypothetical protein